MGRSRWFYAGLTAAISAAAIGAAAQAGAPDPALRLPDLVQEAPADVTVSAEEDGRLLLGFRGAARNEGDGALMLESHRASRKAPAMLADQLVERRAVGRKPLRRAAVGVTRFIRDDDHRHWHFEGFERYELRTPAGQLVARDRKTGFCLGDRYPIAAGVRQPRYERDCGLGRPDLLRVREGISPGFGDAYAAYLEGQWIDITGVALPGTYVLVHTVNPDGRLLESRSDNNTACLGVQLGPLEDRAWAMLPEVATFPAPCPAPPA